MKLVFGIAIVWTFMYCRDQDLKTQIFSGYLSREYNQAVPDSPHVYLLIPQIGCNGCTADVIHGSMECLHHLNGFEQSTLIYSKHGFIDTAISNRITTYFDQNSNLDKLNLDLADVTLLFTKNKKVSYLISKKDTIGLCALFMANLYTPH